MAVMTISISTSPSISWAPLRSPTASHGNSRSSDPYAHRQGSGSVGITDASMPALFTDGVPASDGGEGPSLCLSTGEEDPSLPVRIEVGCVTQSRFLDPVPADG